MHDVRGNILFIILLAVVLFAALAYAVTSSMRGGGLDATQEQSQSYAAEILQYGVSLQNTINRLMLVNDCKDTQISFENPTVSTYTFSTPAKCKLFDPAGGANTFKAIPERYLDKSNAANFDYGNIAVYNQQAIANAGLKSSNSSGDGKDLVMFVPYLTDGVCTAVNKILNVNRIPVDLQNVASANGTQHFKGVYWSMNGGWEVPALVQPHAGCIRTKFNYVETNVVYFLLLAR